MTKGKGSGRNNNFWRNKIKNERKQPNFKFRGRLRSKGESKARSTSGPPQKGQKWTSRITKERTPRAKNSSKMVTPTSNIKGRGKIKAYVIPRQKPLVKSSNNLPQNSQRKRPVTNKKALSLLKKRQAVVKAPVQGSPSKNLKSGISKLKSAILKNQPAKTPTQAKATPSKGASMLKKSVTRIGNAPKPSKNVKPPVIRRGR